MNLIFKGVEFTLFSNIRFFNGCKYGVPLKKHENIYCYGIVATRPNYAIYLYYRCHKSDIVIWCELNDTDGFFPICHGSLFRCLEICLICERYGNIAGKVYSIFHR